MSLIPFVTSWLGESHFAAWPVAVYGAVMLLAGLAYFILTRVLVRHHGRDSELAAAVGSDLKGGISVVVYAVAIPVSFFSPAAACGLYVLVAVIWLIPDRRIETALSNR